MDISEDDYLAHYGILRKSGRYPWGSGSTQTARNQTFLSTIEGLRKEGLSETEIARGFGITTSELRGAKSIAANAEKQARISQAQRLKNKGLSNVAIGEKMGINESSVRSLLSPGQKDRADVLQNTVEMLKRQVDEKNYIDVGSGVENHLDISQTKLSVAIAAMQEQGYKLYYVKVPQLGTGKTTNQKVLVKPGIPYSEVYANRDKVRQITEFSDDGGHSYLMMQPPLSISSKRISVRYADKGGADADGVIYVRPGVDDLSLGKARYAQVRIAVDGTHYLKGMAMYKNDLPEGVDLMFNTNKHSTGDDHDAMKSMKKEDNPFGAIVRQQIDPHSKKVTSAMNIVNEEGDWEKWSKSLSSQVLSKQSPQLAKQQLDMRYERNKQDLEEILALTNPSVRKKLLEAYSESADSAATHLKAAALPRQGSHVILPMNSLKENEVYAPNYNNGERVALVRFPHGGTFEIPELTVNNNHPPAKKALGNARDAIAIHSKVAERLSGADFDGDTVLVIPNNSGRIKVTPALADLKNFDPKALYPAYEGMPKMTARTKGVEMGVVSNLITDMTIHAASSSELARAVRHSMVVIDAEKHNLNYRQSAIDNGIAQLKQKYQDRGTGRAGASTLISRAGATVHVPDRKPRSAANGGPVDRATGKKMYEPTGEQYVNRAGKTIVKSVKSKKLAEVDDAHVLSSGTKIEEVYAEYSNATKALANRARLEAINTKPIPYSPSAKAVYKNQVDTLNSKLNVALKNRPLERQAQVLANAQVALRRQANPDMDPSDLKKIKSQALTEARNRTGARRQQIDITEDEWAAIQAGAISTNVLTQILNKADLDKVKQLATPKVPHLMTSAKTARAKSMAASGYTQAEIAAALGVSVTTLQRSVE